jgi:predicted SAM-dependent methyltransferase
MSLVQPIRSSIYKRKLRRRLSGEIERLTAAGQPLKVVIGSGQTSPNGFLATDKDALDALRESDWAAIFATGSIDRILAEHVIEHWSEAEFKKFLSIARQFLSERGVIRIAVPDGFHPDPDYIEDVRPGGSSSHSHGHKALYNYRTFSQILDDESWKCSLLEYFDESGKFHKADWSEEDGMIHRSAQNDERNKTRALAYTSLIVDVYKK